jgi:class 3 adenylate cyclase
MNKSEGIHFYVNIKNLDEIIQGEEEANDEVKRSIHRLHTFFAGITKAVKHFNGEIEKFTHGRVHVYIEKLDDENDEQYKLRAKRLILSCFTFCYDVFNELGVYSRYTKFKLQGGADYGEYYKYEIEDLDEFTTIGGVANIAAKITNFAFSGYIYITDEAYDFIPDSEQDNFTKLDDDELQEIHERLKGSPSIYKAKYTSLTMDDVIKNLMDDLEEYCKDIADVKLDEIKFESARAKIDFSRLNRKKNKHVTGCIQFADIRGFTKLFNVSDSNLDDLFAVLQMLYQKLNDCVDLADGVRVQFQGDRIVAVFNSFSDESDEDIIRAFEASLKIKDEVECINNEKCDELGRHKLKIGIGISFGEFYATRLGIRHNMDNLVLGSIVKKSDIAEDKYADNNEIVVTKEYKDKVDELSTDSIKCKVILENLTSISTTGYYKTTVSFSDYESRVKELIDEQEANAKEVTGAAIAAKSITTNIGKERTLRPWGN